MATATAGRKIGPIDLSKVSSGFSVIPDGTYRATLSQRSFDVRENGKNQGADTLKVSFNVDAEAHPELKGRKIFDNIDLVESQYWRLRSLADALGASEAEVAAFDADAMLPAYIEANTQVDIVLGHREYPEGSGKFFNQVSRYEKVGGAAPSGTKAGGTKAGGAKPF